MGYGIGGHVLECGAAAPLWTSRRRDGFSHSANWRLFRIRLCVNTTGDDREHCSTEASAWYRPSLTVQIMIGLVVGGVIGWLRPDWGNAVYFLRDIFINLIKSIIAPLVFSTIVVGIAGAGALRKVGRMGIKALIYFEIVTTAALFIGLAVVNLTKPGVGVTLARRTRRHQAIEPNSSQTFVETIVHAFPSEHHRSDGARRRFADRHVQRALRTRGVSVGEKGKPIVRAMDSLSQVMFKFTNT